MFWLFQSLPLVFCLGTGNAVSQTSLVVNGVLGESITLPVKLPNREKVEAVIWHYNEIAIAIIQLNNELESPQVMVLDGKRKNRLNVTQTYSLHLSNLKMADAGSYRVQISMETPLLLSSYTLRIFRRLKNLQVTNHIRLPENGTCEIHLTCSVENPNDTVSFRWQDLGNISSSGPNLTISWDSKNSSKQNYSCIAENPVSSVSFSVSAQSLCKGVLTTENLHWTSTWTLITVSLIAVVITVLCILVWRKRRGSLHFPTAQTQHPVQSSQSTEYTFDSPGNTVYAQVNHPKRETEIPTPMNNEDSFTVYSTVNHSRESKLIFPRATILNDVK
ncbi:SLAM family member 6 [Castor canadensis]|uniref:SLAM family member 6 n=1 Tax=Castor canadensis TaxID=51338 RepID=A0A250YFR6_CASCN|nr:SLAM family member 6 isoform X2 [Castor canadensis]